MGLRAMRERLRGAPPYALASWLGRWARLPVFVFHAVLGPELEDTLRFLGSNGYRTVEADEAARLARWRAWDRRTVALTFDDGHASAYSVALPLLRKYGARGVFFVTTRWPSEAPPRATLEDVWAGRCGPEELHREVAGRTLMSWREIEAVAASGHGDVQPHSRSHLLAYRSARIVDFQCPNAYGQPVYVDPPSHWSDGGGTAWGEPVFEWAWEPTVVTPYVPSRELAEECSRAVSEGGGGEFFREKGWRGRLREVVRRHEGKGPAAAPGVARDGAALLERLTEEIAEARGILERRLGGRRVHFSPPMHSVTGPVLEAARRAGMESVFDGRSRGDRQPGAGGPVMVRRTAGPWAAYLPGRGRRSLWKASLVSIHALVKGADS